MQQAAFHRDGIRLSYPAAWNLQIEGDELSWTATFSASETAFMIVSPCGVDQPPLTLANEVVAAIHSEYKDVDAEAVVDNIGGFPAVGHDIEFMTMDVLVYCVARIVDAPSGPCLFMIQFTELDSTQHKAPLYAVLKSLHFDIRDEP